MPSFSAALLAGGQSTRMGRDKALLPVPGPNDLLWQRQVRVLEELQPEEIFWSGFARTGIPERIRIIPDTVTHAGPLAGISACLEVLQSDLLVVLAVDLPRMTAAFLKNLQTKCSHSCGIVAHHGEFFEPLAAIYPKALHLLAADHLRQNRYAVQDFVREAAQRGLLQAFPLGDKDIFPFKNLNSPIDLQED